MSAYLCTPKHVAALAAWAASNDHLERHMESLARDAGAYGYDLSELAGALATILASENLASVAYRYSEYDPTGPGFVAECKRLAARLAHTLAIKTAPPMHVLKAVDCLEYQSCERPEWEGSTARQVLSAIRRSAITKLPGYSDAAWGWTEEPARTPENIARAMRGERVS